jgi:hypothetical protein
VNSKKQIIYGLDEVEVSKNVSFSSQKIALVYFNLLMSSYNAHSYMCSKENFILGIVQQSKAN